MKDLSNLPHFSYEFDQGPLSQELFMNDNFEGGNCRLAVQIFLYQVKGIFIPPEEILAPYSFLHLGSFVYKAESGIELAASSLEKGDIIFAQRIKNSAGESINRDPESYKTTEDWIISLHTAVIADNENGIQIWHATAIENGTCFWTLEKFQEYYKVVAVKRIL
jgi:hypothetical protein